MKRLLKSFRVQSGASRQPTMLKAPTVEQILSVSLEQMKQQPCSKPHCESKTRYRDKVEATKPPKSSAIRILREKKPEAKRLFKVPSQSSPTLQSMASQNQTFDKRKDSGRNLIKPASSMARPQTSKNRPTF